MSGAWRQRELKKRPKRESSLVSAKVQLVKKETQEISEKKITTSKEEKSCGGGVGEEKKVSG